MRRLSILLMSLAIALPGLASDPAHATSIANGTYLCTTGELSGDSPSFEVLNGVVSNGGSCVGDVVIPAGVTSIGDYAFAYASSIESVTFAEGSLLSSIGDVAFYLTSSLTSMSIPAGVTSIGAQAFKDASSLTTVTFAEGSSLSFIGNGAFDGASSLTSISLPAGVTSIGNQVFYRATSLTSFVIPAGVTSIGSYAFMNASSLSRVDFLGNAPVVGDYAFFGNGLSPKAHITSSATGFPPDGQSWNGLTVSAERCYIITDGVVSDGSSCAGDVVIPAGVTSIADYAFTSTDDSGLAGATSLETVSFAEGSLLSSIGDFAFYGASSLTSVVVPAGVISIGDYAFAGASSLTSVVIPAGVTSIGDYTFTGASALESVTFSEGSLLTSIGEDAFAGASLLTSVSIPVGVVSIGGGAFSRTSSLVTVAFAEGSLLSSIGGGAFFQANSLTSIVIPAGVTSIGSYAFYRASSLVTVAFANGSLLTSIGSGAFYGASSLTSFVVPAGVTSIGSYAFLNASSLTRIDFLGDAPVVGDMAFSGNGPSPKARILSSAIGFSALGQLWNGLTVDFPLTVSYISNGGSPTISGQFEFGGSIAAPTPPSRDGYDFAGWSETDGGVALVFPFSPVIASHVTLYAKWDEVPPIDGDTPSTLTQTITLSALVDRVFSETPFTVTATSDSDLLVTLVSSTPGVCVVSFFQVTMLSAGLCTLTASQGGDSTYLNANDVERSFTITSVIPTTTTTTTTTTTLPTTTTTMTPTTTTTMTPTTTTTTTPTTTTLPTTTTTMTPTTTTTVAPSTPTTVAPPAESVVVALPLANTPLVADNSLAAGGEVSVTFSGFVPGEFVQLIVVSTPQVIGSGYANAQGVVTLTGNIPAGLAVGNHTLAVYAPVSGIGFKQPISVEALSLPATGSSQRLWPIMMILFGGAALIVGSRRRLSQT